MEVYIRDVRREVVVVVVVIPSYLLSSVIHPTHPFFFLPKYNGFPDGVIIHKVLWGLCTTHELFDDTLAVRQRNPDKEIVVRQRNPDKGANEMIFF
jgi:hypothetical protein